MANEHHNGRGSEDRDRQHSGRHHSHNERSEEQPHPDQRRSGFHTERSRMDQPYAESPGTGSVGHRPDDPHRYRDPAFPGLTRERGGPSPSGPRQDRDNADWTDRPMQSGRWRDDADRDEGRHRSGYVEATEGTDSGPYRSNPGIASGPSGWAGARGLDASEGGYRQSNHYGRGRHAGRGPKGYQRSDERICEDVCERLTEADEIDASELSVRVVDRVVHLSGTVEARWIKHRVEDIADGCSGVTDVRNDIRVVRAGAGESTAAVTPDDGHSPLVTERPKTLKGESGQG